jgi:hypothetical protein
MRKLPAIGALAGLVALAAPVSADYFTATPGPLPRGVGCYWHRGVHYCNRYCYREVDGYWFCQPRLRDATSQAPPALFVAPVRPPDARPPRRRGP